MFFIVKEYNLLANTLHMYRHIEIGNTYRRGDNIFFRDVFMSTSTSRQSTVLLVFRSSFGSTNNQLSMAPLILPLA